MEHACILRSGMWMLTAARAVRDTGPVRRASCPCSVASTPCACPLGQPWLGCEAGCMSRQEGETGREKEHALACRWYASSRIWLSGCYGGGIRGLSDGRTAAHWLRSGPPGSALQVTHIRCPIGRVLGPPAARLAAGEARPALQPEHRQGAPRTTAPDRFLAGLPCARAHGIGRTHFMSMGWRWRWLGWAERRVQISDRIVKTALGGEGSAGLQCQSFKKTRAWRDIRQPRNSI